MALDDPIIDYLAPAIALPLACIIPAASSPCWPPPANRF
jgi:hypothetical protein